jgi:flagellar hook-associated protein 3 FlgL
VSTFPRISFLGANHASQLRLRQAYGRLDKANQQVATGKAYSRPSENTSAAARAAVVQDQLDQLNSFDRAIDDSRSRLSVADTKMSQAMDLYQRATELATQGATSINSPESRMSIREEVLQLRGELEAIGNSTYLGAPIFAGLGSGNAVTFNAATSTWTFSGAPTEKLSRRIGSSEVVDASITAGELFSNGSGNIFGVLDQLASDLASNNTAGIQGALNNISTLRSTLSAGQARLGAVLNRVDQASSRNSALKISMTTELANLEQVDMADAVTDQNRLNVAYQAALGVTAKASQQTLLDWLR